MKSLTYHGITYNQLVIDATTMTLAEIRVKHSMSKKLQAKCQEWGIHPLRVCRGCLEKKTHKQFSNYRAQRCRVCRELPINSLKAQEKARAGAVQSEAAWHRARHRLMPTTVERLEAMGSVQALDPYHYTRVVE